MVQKIHIVIMNDCYNVKIKYTSTNSSGNLPGKIIISKLVQLFFSSEYNFYTPSATYFLHSTLFFYEGQLHVPREHKLYHREKKLYYEEEKLYLEYNSSTHWRMKVVLL